ncbi:MAG: hypothetical protein PHD70_14500 [Anaerostipes sp.]|nr:hypothetical protein [Anaerostipes sp.]
MTNEEAIRYLKITRDCREDGSVGELTRQMCDKAIEALEKQIPKKVNIDNATSVKAFDGENKVETFKCVPCPICGKWIVKNESTRYCSSCGQKLKWD